MGLYFRQYISVLQLLAVFCPGCDTYMNVYFCPTTSMNSNISPKTLPTKQRGGLGTALRFTFQQRMLRTTPLHPAHPHEKIDQISFRAVAPAFLHIPSSTHAPTHYFRAISVPVLTAATAAPNIYLVPIRFSSVPVRQGAEDTMRPLGLHGKQTK